MGANSALESNLSNTATLTSLDLADITGSRHDNVQRSIKRSVKNGAVTMPPFEKGPAGAGGRKVGYYVFRGDKGKRDSFRVLERMTSAQADAIAARWRELEAEASVALTSTVGALTTRVASPVVEAPPTGFSLAARIVSPDAEQLTMSSIEIAQLTGKEHRNVLADIRKMLEALGHSTAEFSAVYEATNGQAYDSFNLPRRETDILLTGYHIPARARVIDRWHQLEEQVAKPAFSVPTTFAEALRLAGELEEQRVALTHQVGMQAVKIAEDAPKIETYTKLVDSRGFINFQQFCTKLNLHQVKVKEWLRDIGWLRDNQWEVNPLPTAKAVDAGYCVIKDFITDSGRLVQSIKFTGKAETYVYEKAPDYIRKKVRQERKKKVA
ncbi:Rha family transcriptional regulator [Pseudomonas monteilii]|uniref:Rha family transcriptional regulator n=1 Tax=Pseudomonas monteilii TaxID=76759 RepID=UPI001CBB090F|nr:Rha family transcriptional regulator [Pseudomonas monteilii]MBZ3664480.1 Rha family transcriptional regulator [Pseudomonas monteilii]MBZ3670062.1 Rha family transcriptional regulator [Pseudomonas monteilii]